MLQCHWVDNGFHSHERHPRRSGASNLDAKVIQQPAAVRLDRSVQFATLMASGRRPGVPALPMTRGRAGTTTSEYKRNETTTLFTALNVADRTVIGSCMDRHRHEGVPEVGGTSAIGADQHVLVQESARPGRATQSGKMPPDPAPALGGPLVSPRRSARNLTGTLPACATTLAAPTT